ncbi:MAG: hypothetical protein ACK5GQ_13120, partial [Burkholderiales bacterium]
DHPVLREQSRVVCDRAQRPIGTRQKARPTRISDHPSAAAVRAVGPRAGGRARRGPHHNAPPPHPHPTNFVVLKTFCAG